MPESDPKNLADAPEPFSFFQTETETLAGQMDKDQFVLSENPPVALPLISQPRLDSDNDCACE